MLQPVNQDHITYYTDASNAKRGVKHSVVHGVELSEELKSKIAEDICRIFISNPIKS